MWRPCRLRATPTDASPTLAFMMTSLLQSTLAVWVKWPQHPSTPTLAGSKRQFGSVCHQDPR